MDWLRFLEILLKNNSTTIQRIPPMEKEKKFEFLENRYVFEKFNSKVIGKIKNNAPDSYSSVFLTIDLFDKTGILVGSTTATVNNLESKGIGEFEAHVTQEDVASYKIVGIDYR